MSVGLLSILFITDLIYYRSCLLPILFINDPVYYRSYAGLDRGRSGSRGWIYR